MMRRPSRLGFFRPVQRSRLGVTVDPEVMKSLIESGTAITTTAIEQASKKKKSSSGSGKSAKKGKKSEPVEAPAPMSIPWGPIALGAAGLVTAGLLLFGRRPAPMPAYTPMMARANPRKRRRRRRAR